MARLPVPGGDDGAWGGILNEFLNQAHNSDGTLRTNAVRSALPDASATSKGVIRLTGDLAGTAASPTVPGLAGKYELPSGGIPESDLDSSVQTKLNSSASDATTTSKGVVRLAGDLSGTADSPSVPALGDKIEADSADTLTNKTITDNSNDLTANSLRTSSGSVDVAAAAAPGSGQFLRASDTTTAAWQAMPRMFGWYLNGQLVVGDGQGPIFVIDADVTIVGVDVSCKIAPTGSSATFDIETGSSPNGIFNTIFSVQPSIADGQNIGSGGTLSVTQLSAGDYVRLNIDQVGATTPAEGLTAQLRMETR